MSKLHLLAWVILIFSCFRGWWSRSDCCFRENILPSRPEVWSAGPFWYHQLLQWDLEWYFKIVTEGYRYNGDPTIQQNVVFYPLYPTGFDPKSFALSRTVRISESAKLRHGL